MIERIEFHNFKALRDVSLDLQRFTVLVGPNASGKTSVLEGVDYLSRVGVVAGRPLTRPGFATTSAFFPKKREAWKVFPTLDAARELVTVGCGGEMSLAGRFDAKWIRLELLLIAIGEELETDPEQVQAGHWQSVEELRGEKGEEGVVSIDVEVGDQAPLGAGFLHGIVFLRFEPNRLVAPSYSNDQVPKMASNGEGLASVLAHMASDRPDDFEELLASLREVIPFVRAIRLPRAAITRTESEVITVDDKTFSRQTEKTYWGNSIEFDMDGAPGIPARMASEGTMLVLALLTAIMGPERPQIVLLDDLDRALHPKAQEDLVRLLRKLLEKNPQMQIVATSHSPYLLDHLAPEEVRLTVLNDEGAVVAGRLDEHPEFEKWKETMAPGEFWSMVGEKWLLEAGSGDSQ